jgi:hypothetical protein
MRASNVCETVTRARPELLQPRKRDFLRQVSRVEQQEVRWHWCQMLPRLKLTPRERTSAYDLLKRFLDDKSGIVRTFAMQAMTDLAVQDPSHAPQTLETIEHLTRTGTPAMRSRGRMLLKVLKSG